MNSQICFAISSKRQLEFVYDGLSRTVEPHAHGVSSTGRHVLLGFQTEGKSSSGPLGWRLWNETKMESFSVSHLTFAEARPDYVRGASHMQQMHCEL